MDEQHLRALDREYQSLRSADQRRDELVQVVHVYFLYPRALSCRQQGQVLRHYKIKQCPGFTFQPVLY